MTSIRRTQARPPASADPDLFAAPNAASLLRGVLDSSPAGVAIVDSEGRYRYVNDVLAAMNGLPAAEHLGRTVREVLPEAADGLEALLNRVLEGEELVGLELEAPGFEARTFRATYLPVDLEGERVALGMVVETTRSVQTEHELRMSEERLRLALEGTATGTWEWDARANEVRWADNLGPLHGLPRGAAPRDYDEWLQGIHADDHERLAGLVRRALEEGHDYDVEYRALWPDGSVHWLESRAHVVSGNDGRPLALVGLTSDVTERKRREQAAQFLARASLLLSESLDPDETLRRLAHLAVPDLADWCAIHVPNPAGELEALEVAHADPERAALAWDLTRRGPPRRDSPAGAAVVLRSGRSELYPEVTDEVLRAAAQNAEHLGLLRALDLRSAMVVPIVARGQTLGAMSFVFSESGRKYTSVDLEVGEDLGRRAGLALENARLLAAREHAYERLEALQTVTDVGLTHLALDDLLRELLLRIRAVLSADTAAILLIDEERRDLAVTAAVGLEEQLDVHDRVPLAQGFAGRIAASSQPLVLNAVAPDDVVSGLLRERVRALAGVPLVHDEQTIGVLHVGSTTPREFTRSDVELLELVAARAAQAIVHARLYERVHDTALTLQRSLLPARLPDAPGVALEVRYQPGQEGAQVGGDWYDVLALPGGELALIVGDVAGRGVDAAATMGGLRAAVRAYVLGASGPSGAVRALDRMLLQTDADTVASLLVLYIDRSRRQAVACCAGHPPPVLIAPGGPPVFATVDGGPMVGAPGAQRRETVIALGGPGARLLLYTDGLVERRTRSLDDGFAELLEAAAAAPSDPGAMLDHVLERLLSDVDQPDDVAVLALEVRD